MDEFGELEHQFERHIDDYLGGGSEESPPPTNPYRESSDLAVIGDGLQTAIEQISGHEERVTSLECFVAAREHCSGDDAYDLVKDSARVHSSTLRTLGWALGVLGGVFCVFLTCASIVWANMSGKIEALEDHVHQLEVETRDSVDTVNELGYRLGYGPMKGR